MHPYFNIFSRLVPAYGVMMMLGLLTAGSIGMFRVRHRGECWADAMVILACSLGFAMAGAAGLYLAVTYPLRKLWEMILSRELFSGNRLGLVFYGGLLGAIPGAWLGARLAHARLADYIPAMVPCIPLGHAFGRIGCLLAGCCYGIPTKLPIGIIYPEGTPSAPAGVLLFPVQAVEALVLLVLFGILVLYTRRSRPAQRVVGLYFLLYAVCRFGLEFLRYDAIRGHLGILSTSQWISAALFLTGIILLGCRNGDAVRLPHSSSLQTR